MRTRNRGVLLYLSDDELSYLDNLVSKSACTREAYLRSLIKGVIPADKPPPDYLSMMYELHAIGTNLNQIAQKANTLGVIDSARYDAETKNLSRAITEIVQAVKTPKRV